MSRYSDTILDSYGRPVPGASVYVYDLADPDTPVLETLLDDAAQPLANPLTTDEFGAFYFNADDGEKQLDVWFRGIRRWREEILVGPKDAGPTGPAGDVAKVDTRVELAEIEGQEVGAARQLVEAGRAGMFVWIAASLAALVAVDTAQAIYVPPTGQDGSTGAWVRQFDGPLNIQWAGAVADDPGSGAGATDSYAAINTTIKVASAMGVDHTFGGNQARGARPVYVPTGKFYSTGTFDITTGGGVIFGDCGQYGMNRSSQIRWAPGVTGFRTQRSNTSGVNDFGGDQLYPTSDNCVFRGLALIGAYGLAGVEGEFHGIHERSRAHVEDCYIAGWQGDGRHTSASAPNGNANQWSGFRCGLYGNRNGHYLVGADVNAGLGILIDASFNRQRGIYDYGFLGSNFKGCHSLSNGITDPLGGVNYGTECYTPVIGQEEAARTNAPSGTTADNAYWWWVATYNQVAWPTWTNGMAARRSSGGYLGRNPNSSTVFDDCYSEGEGPSVVEGHGQFRNGTYSSRPPIGPHFFTQQGSWGLRGGLSIIADDGSDSWGITNNNDTLNIGPSGLFRFYAAGYLMATSGFATAEAGAINARGRVIPPVPEAKTAAYTLVLADSGATFIFDVAADTALNFPAHATAALAIGTEIYFVQKGAGAVVPTGVGSTLRFRGAVTKTAGQWAIGMAKKIADNEWVISGDLA